MKTLNHLALIFLVLAVSSSLIVPRLVAAQAPQIKIEYSRGEATAGGQKDNEFYPYKFDLCFPPGIDSRMTSIDPPGNGKTPEARVAGETPPKRSLVFTDRTEKGTIRRYSDGSTMELKSDVTIETFPGGTRIEKLANGTTMVKWPNRAGYVRYPDGKGARIAPDGSVTDTPGTIEIKDDASVIHRMTDEGVIREIKPDGTVRSRPDLVEQERQKSSAQAEPVKGLSRVDPERQVSMGSRLVTMVQSCNESLFGAVIQTDASTAGVPLLATTTVEVKEQKPGLFDALIPALVPSIGIGIGGGKGRDRRHPNPCAGR